MNIQQWNQRASELAEKIAELASDMSKDIDIFNKMKTINIYLEEYNRIRYGNVDDDDTRIARMVYLNRRMLMLEVDLIYVTGETRIEIYKQIEELRQEYESWHQQIRNRIKVGRPEPKGFWYTDESGTRAYLWTK